MAPVYDSGLLKLELTHFYRIRTRMLQLIMSRYLDTYTYTYAQLFHGSTRALVAAVAVARGHMHIHSHTHKDTLALEFTDAQTCVHRE